MRGAYLHIERHRAADKGYSSPVWDSLEETDENYNACALGLLRRVATEGAEVMLATHNPESIQLVVDGMQQLDLPPKTSGVYFGQLMGMADNLTFVLGRNGYRGYKYVPYGPVKDVMPYLIRRAQENSDIMVRVEENIDMIRRELVRRRSAPKAASASA